MKALLPLALWGAILLVVTPCHGKAMPESEPVEAPALPEDNGSSNDRLLGPLVTSLAQSTGGLPVVGALLSGLNQMPEQEVLKAQGVVPGESGATTTNLVTAKAPKAGRAAGAKASGKAAGSQKPSKAPKGGASS